MFGRAVRSFIVVVSVSALWAVAPSVALASGDPSFVVGHRAGPIPISGGLVFGQIGSLAVSAGNWAASARLDVVGHLAASRRVTCRLSAGGDFDVAMVAVSTPDGRSSLALDVTHSFAASGSILIRCTNNGLTGDATAVDVRLQAMRVGRLERHDLSAGSSSSTGSGSPLVITGWFDAPTLLPAGTGHHLITSLPLRHGNWAIRAKVVAEAASSSTPQIDCQLRAGGDLDDHASDVFGYATESLELVHVSPSSEASPTVSLYCASSSAGYVKDVKITAMKVGTLSNQPLPGSGASSTGTGSPIVRAAYLDTMIVDGGNVFRTVGTLHMPQGTWVATATLGWANGSFGTLRCELAAGGDVDEIASKHTVAGTSLAITHTYGSASGGPLTLRCAFSGGSADVQFYKVFAIEAGTLSTHPL